MPFDKRLLILIPIILSSFTHLWNTALFPSFHIDEGVYIRRALHALNGLGILDPDSKFDHPQDTTSSYDHPFFGQIVLASIFKIIDYPHTFISSSEKTSIESLFSVPRLAMGVFAIVDTFLIYKIGERRFNPTVGLFSSLLFAVMPSTWYTRRVVLDSIMLPFILTSILLILETKIRPNYVNMLSLLSGISLGLAVFTKIPSFTLIPLLVYLILQVGERRPLLSKIELKKLALFLIPVILIPLIWPTYALLSGDLDQWFDGVIWQATSRQSEDKTLFDVGLSFFRSDPVIVILGTIGIIYLAIRREFIGVIWTLPYITFLYLVGWVNHFHFILILPILCISLAKIIYDLPSFVITERKATIISSGMIAAIVLFGIISTFTLISTNLSYIQLQTASYIGNEMSLKSLVSNDSENSNDYQQVTVITGPIYSWIYKYVYHN
ncbi:MAG TPA: glycosyltransferase family 39 protein, partial [Nitrososphaeraceae archaeon]|nr:glycosyltransferase family 39 protein [Nitrososphaeraceae archaeon]